MDWDGGVRVVFFVLLCPREGNYFQRENSLDHFFKTDQWASVLKCKKCRGVSNEMAFPLLLVHVEHVLLTEIITFCIVEKWKQRLGGQK